LYIYLDIAVLLTAKHCQWPAKSASVSPVSKLTPNFSYSHYYSHCAAALTGRIIGLAVRPSVRPSVHLSHTDS